MSCHFSLLERFSRLLNSLNPNSGENEISLNIITTCSNIQVITIKDVITKDTMS